MWNSIQRLLARIKAVFQAGDLDRELAAELEAHVKLLADEHMGRGVEPEEAERLARVELGGVSQLREAHRDVRGLPFLDTLQQDLRYTFRTLRHHAGFTVFAILITGLGIGASATVFSTVNALLIRPLPFPDAKRLVWIYNLADDGVSEWNTQVGHYLDLRQVNRSFSDLTAYSNYAQPGDAKLSGDGLTERLNSLRVAQNFFPFLGVQPILGRNFTADECKYKAAAAAVMSYGLWKRRFASDPGVVGRTMTLNDSPVTIVGVVPETFDFGSVFSPGNRVDLYLTMPLTSETNGFGNVLAVIGRLKPTVTTASARAEFRTLADRLQRQHPERNMLRPVLKPLEEHVTGRLQSALLVLAWAVGVVMLIVCANVANLQLVRMAARQKEMAIRAAIGAGRHRLILQMLTESLSLSFCGAALGVVLAIGGTRLLAGLTTFKIPLLATIRIDATSLGFVALMAVVSGLLFGMTPALQVPFYSVHDSLKESSRGISGTKGHIRLRSALVVSEIVFACVLLVGAGLLARSLVNVLSVDLGFQPERAAALRVDPGAGFATLAQRDSYYREILARVRTLPGINGAGLTDVLPLASDRSWDVTAKGKQYERGHYPEGFIRIISDGYLEAMGIPLRAGRAFSERDTRTSEPVALVNETLARTLWPGRSAIGQILLAQGSNGLERRVVGVVGNVRHRTLEQDAGCELYMPFLQWDEKGAAMHLIVRTAIPPGALAVSLRTALRPIAPEPSTNQFETIEELVDKAVSPRRFVVVLLAGFSGFSLMLAALGIYAVISYSVKQREAELGIRMALGAPVWDLQVMIVLQTLGLAGMGMAIGSCAAWVLARAIGGMLFGVTAEDPVTFVGTMAVLTGVACLAGYLPALRVSKIEPMGVLRG